MLKKVKESFFKGENEPKRTDYFKMNIPESILKYKEGNGEGVWVLPLTEEDKKLYDKDSYGDKIQVVLSNNSIYFQPLIYGTIVQAETRGPGRPVLDIYWLAEEEQFDITEVFAETT